jgi:hypothetical protein
MHAADHRQNLLMHCANNISKHNMPVTSTKQSQSAVAAAATTHKPTTTTQHAGLKILSLNELITKLRVLDDAKTVARLEKLLLQPAYGADGKPKPPLSQSTMHEYTANLKVFQTNGGRPHMM